MKSITIGPHIVQEYTAPFIIAEIGANYNGDIEIAKEMILKAKEAGVECVKFQSWTKESIMAKQLYHQKTAELTVFGHEKQGDLLDFLSMSEQDHGILKEFCDQEGIMFATTPFTFRHVDVLADLDVDFFKIASMEINHTRFLEYIGKQGKPTLMSTGMSSISEVARAVDTFLSTGNDQLILLHCVALYPPQDEEANLNNIDLLRDVFGLQVGYSDHTLGFSIPLASVAKGVSVIEKHYTLDKSLPGWDHAVSATPDEFAILTRESKRIHAALGSKQRVVSKREQQSRDNMRRSIVAATDLPAGHIIQLTDLDYKRPGTGIEPWEDEKLIGRQLTRSVEADHLFDWEDVNTQTEVFAALS